MVYCAQYLLRSNWYLLLYYQISVLSRFKIKHAPLNSVEEQIQSIKPWIRFRIKINEPRLILMHRYPVGRAPVHFMHDISAGFLRYAALRSSRV